MTTKREPAPTTIREAIAAKIKAQSDLGQARWHVDIVLEEVIGLGKMYVATLLGSQEHADSALNHDLGMGAAGVATFLTMLER